MYPRSSKVGTPRVDHQETIQELIDLAIMTDRASRGDFGGVTGVQGPEVQAMIDAAFALNPGISEAEVQALIDAYAETNSSVSFRGEWSGLSVVTSYDFSSGLPTAFTTSGSVNTTSNSGGTGAPATAFVANIAPTTAQSSLSLVIPQGITAISFYTNEYVEGGAPHGGFDKNEVELFSNWGAWAWRRDQYDCLPGQTFRWWISASPSWWGAMRIGLVQLMTAMAPYLVGDSVTYQGSLYVCNTLGTGATPGVDGAWSKLLSTATSISQTFSKSGVLTTGAGTNRLVNTTGHTLSINAVTVSVGTAPTGASILVDVTKNGTSIFTTQANRPTIVAGAFSGVSGVPELTWAAGEYLTVDVDQIGSTVAGSDLTVQVSAK